MGVELWDMEYDGFQGSLTLDQHALDSERQFEHTEVYLEVFQSYEI